MNLPLLQAHGISKNFYHPFALKILKNIHFQVMQQESVAIIGRSGEGKSTLLHILGTLEQACEGFLSIAGEKVSSANRAKIRNKHIGFVFQSFHLLEDYTALDNVLMPARIARNSVQKGSEALKKGYALLEQVGLADRAQFSTKYLSGGEKQRVALARAMCNNPTLLLADEPSGNLDRQTASFIHEILFDFSQQPQKALLLVTHDKELAQLCTRQYELRDGQLFTVK